MTELYLKRGGLIWNFIVHKSWMYNGEFVWDFDHGNGNICTLVNAFLLALIGSIFWYAVCVLGTASLLTAAWSFAMFGRPFFPDMSPDIASVLALFGMVFWCIGFVVLTLFVVIPKTWGLIRYIAKKIFNKHIEKSAAFDGIENVCGLVVTGISSKMHKFCSPVKLK